jgi:hypothetical protein
MIKPKKNKLKLISRFILVPVVITIIILSFILGPNIYQDYKLSKIKIKYSRIQNWYEAEELFNSDLKNNELKYFYFGWGYNNSFDSLGKKYNLDVIFMGDIIKKNLGYYDYFIESRIIKKNISGRFFGWKADSVWSDFVNAFEQNNLNYFLKNSSDSILYSGPIFLKLKNDKKYNSEFIFEDLSKSKYFWDIISKQFNKSFDENKFIQINYYIDSTIEGKKVNDMVFIFERENYKYLFNKLIVE